MPQHTLIDLLHLAFVDFLEYGIRPGVLIRVKPCRSRGVHGIFVQRERYDWGPASILEPRLPGGGDWEYLEGFPADQCRPKNIGCSQIAVFGL